MATASMDGSVKFFQINTSEDEVLKWVEKFGMDGVAGIYYL